ncbi:CamS family sex pheromone protein [Lentilactobacillus parabuchneri]|jgi:protein involved in sex pheromone biosynthesis|uniref:CamS family sex pheromone protein n=1 Tax=uncultured Lentilactobacillus sp. TaxID=2805375 RepID=UPI000A10D6F4|nr:CamS family sex pheromone protein [Lentilactobacillus parabuchneri]MDB1103337.1 CamS family sex pheromone protein [Lentilactobacillus parabuchneri]MDN6434434.1 CamS family sex pheromone protein [Lentilactobacillus parabuchneri]MDN6781423.1 CamS family sex pheromone protein [Lentilactobacillus parabuchneri]MDN6786655.1 CamS family sex pheromone protein [Lentilactobacillus parabuchneri]MDN6807905.1 CamS family sex pheromone protein [Lentilactobacillus parabuchneri]
MEEQKLKKIILGISIILSGFMLSACGSVDNLSSDTSNSSSSSTKTQLTGQTNTDYYQGVIKNGRYQTSKSRGVSVSQESNQFNIKGFENGLLDISKKEFSTKKYIFQEGQYLSTSTVENWLGRKSKSNPTGLNPVKSKSTNPTTRTPVYLSQIDEQDFMTQNGKSLKLSAMTVGLAINSVDYYKKTAYGPTYETNISDAAVKQHGQEIANQVIKRLRQRPALKNIPIVIALYKQASDDSLVGGNFFDYSVNDNGETKISKWTKINQKNYVFPLQSDKKGPSQNDADSFDNFKSQIQGFFPNLSGVTAQAQYTDGSLSGMNISITTQFYSQTEIISFTQYIQNAAQRYLPANAPIDITVSSTEGIQSFLSRKQNEKKFSAHIFNSY